VSLVAEVQKDLVVFNEAIEKGVRIKQLVEILNAKNPGLNASVDTFKTTLKRVRKRLKASDPDNKVKPAKLPSKRISKPKPASGSTTIGKNSTKPDSECNNSSNSDRDTQRPSKKRGLAKAEAFMAEQRKKEGWDS